MAANDPPIERFPGSEHVAAKYWAWLVIERNKVKSLKTVIAAADVETMRGWDMCVNLAEHHAPLVGDDVNREACDIALQAASEFVRIHNVLTTR